MTLLAPIILTGCVKSYPQTNVALVECPPKDEELRSDMTVAEFKKWTISLANEYKLCRSMVHKAILKQRSK